MNGTVPYQVLVSIPGNVRRSATLPQVRRCPGAVGAAAGANCWLWVSFRPTGDCGVIPSRVSEAGPKALVCRTARNARAFGTACPRLGTRTLGLPRGAARRRRGYPQELVNPISQGVAAGDAALGADGRRELVSPACVGALHRARALALHQVRLRGRPGASLRPVQPTSGRS